MGNRVRIQMKHGSELSPVIYGHWSGSRAAEAIVACRERMSDRPYDISYCAARMLQELMGKDADVAVEGSTGFGLGNQEKELTEKDAEDAGCFVITLGRVWKVTIKGGSVREHGKLTNEPGKVEFSHG